MKHKIALATAAATIIGASILGTSLVSAQEANGNDHMSSLIQKLADKFGVSTDEVQAVFEEDRSEHQAERQAEYETRLDELVSNGEITESQKALILAKHEEIQAARDADHEAMQDLTPEERRSQMETQRTELETWAEENGIDMQYLMDFGREGRGGHRGMGMPPEDATVSETVQ